MFFQRKNRQSNWKKWGFFGPLCITQCSVLVHICVPMVQNKPIFLAEIKLFLHILYLSLTKNEKSCKTSMGPGGPSTWVSFNQSLKVSNNLKMSVSFVVCMSYTEPKNEQSHNLKPLNQSLLFLDTRVDWYRVWFSQMEISWLILPPRIGDSTIAPLWSTSLVTSAPHQTQTARSIFTFGHKDWGEKSEARNAVELLPHQANYLSAGQSWSWKPSSKVQL